MGLDVPELDDREYEELLDEAKQLIPAYSEEWTDFNPHDPGITILEVLAWLTETYVYQVDRVTDEHREKYLKLVGEKRRPPTPASVRLAMDVPEGAAGAVIPAGEKLTVSDGSDRTKVFETDGETVLTEARVERVVAEHSRGRTDHSHANETDEMFYRAFGDRAAADSALYLGIDGDPFENADRLSVSVDFHEADLPDPATHGDEAPTFDPSVEVAWEYCTDYPRSDRDEAWSRLAVVEDDTDRFYRGGTVTLARPDDWNPPAWAYDRAGVVDQPPGLVWIRCRVVEPGWEIPPQLDAVSLNVLEASHRSTVEDEVLQRAYSTEDPRNLTEQRYRFEHSPVLDATVTVGGDRWREVEDFDASGPNDEHYVLDRSEGAVEFGDGVRGTLPQPGERVIAEEYVHGGGEAGNVPASSLFKFDGDDEIADGVRLGDVTLDPVDRALGGTDRESVQAAVRRVKRDLRTPYRGVTPEDYEYVATHTPGLRFGRSTVVVDHGSGTEDPAEIRVVVVPYAPEDVSRPEPSEGFLDAVQRHLDRHRLLTDRVTAEPPTYVGLELEVEVRSLDTLRHPGREAEVRATVEDYVDPIHGFGGDGWPFGRALYFEELHELLAGIEWVDHVRDVTVTAHGNATVDSSGNVLVGDTSLLYLDDCTVTVQTRTRPVADGRGE